VCAAVPCDSCKCSIHTLCGSVVFMHWPQCGTVPHCGQWQYTCNPSISYVSLALSAWHPSPPAGRLDAQHPVGWVGAAGAGWLCNNSINHRQGTQLTSSTIQGKAQLGPPSIELYLALFSVNTGCRHPFLGAHQAKAILCALQAHVQA
jgi:hypothetical protein